MSTTFVAALFAVWLQAGSATPAPLTRVPAPGQSGSGQAPSTPGAVEEPDTGGAAEIATVEPGGGELRWGGSTSEGLATIARLSESGEGAEALELARALLNDQEDEHVRAEVHYAAGLVQARTEALEPALEDYASARTLGGPGVLRLDAGYNAGVAVLESAERWRAQIPALGGAAAGAPGGLPGGIPGLAAPGATGGPGAAGAGDAPDPMEAARADYERARALLLERLREDWQDADTRANLELIVKRLRELDELEQEQEEQEQEQQDENQESEDSEESEDGEPQEDPQDESEDSEGEQPEEPEPGEEEPQEEPPQPEGEDAEEPEEEQPQESEPEPEPSEEDPKDEVPEPPAGEPEERFMTREEAMRLLDRLAEIEEQGEKLRAQLTRRSRRAVERDW